MAIQGGKEDLSSSPPPPAQRRPAPQESRSYASKRALRGLPSSRQGESGFSHCFATAFPPWAGVSGRERGPLSPIVWFALEASLTSLLRPIRLEASVEPLAVLPKKPFFPLTWSAGFRPQQPQVSDWLGQLPAIVSPTWDFLHPIIQLAVTWFLHS